MAAMFLRVALVAHEGGWDEILLVAGPIVVIIAVLAVAKRRVDRGLGGSGGAAPPDAAPADATPRDDDAP
jgi:hypothetical protein